MGRDGGAERAPSRVGCGCLPLAGGSRRRFLPEEAGGEAPDCRDRVIGLPPALMRGSAGAQMFLCCHGAGPGNGQEPEKAFCSV